MKAKDTALTDKELFELWDGGLTLPEDTMILMRDVAKTQAEISFKAVLRK